MTDIDDLLDEVAIRTDSSRHWTGQSKLTISDAELAKELAVAVRALRDRPCPHIETGDDGTSHCTLAEGANTAWAARWQQQHDRAEQAEAARCTCYPDPADHDDDCPLLASDRPGGTDNPTSDEPVCRTCANSGWWVGLRHDPQDCPTCGRKPYFLNGGTYPAPAPTGGDDG